MADEVVILYLFEDDEEVPRRTAIGSCIATTADSHLHAFADTCWDIDIHDLLTALYTSAVAYVTLILDLLAGTVACRTSRLCLHASEDALLYLHDYTRTVTGRTCLHATASLCAAATTVVALHVFLDFELLRRAGEYLLEGELDTDTQV